MSDQYLSVGEFQRWAEDDRETKRRILDTLKDQSTAIVKNETAIAVVSTQLDTMRTNHDQQATKTRTWSTGISAAVSAIVSGVVSGLLSSGTK